LSCRVEVPLTRGRQRSGQATDEYAPGLTPLGIDAVHFEGNEVAIGGVRHEPAPHPEVHLSTVMDPVVDGDDDGRLVDRRLDGEAEMTDCALLSGHGQETKAFRSRKNS
jgi:hypothetical protein